MGFGSGTGTSRDIYDKGPSKRNINRKLLKENWRFTTQGVIKVNQSEISGQMHKNNYFRTNEGDLYQVPLKRVVVTDREIIGIFYDLKRKQKVIGLIEKIKGVSN